MARCGGTPGGGRGGFHVAETAFGFEEVLVAERDVFGGQVGVGLWALRRVLDAGEERIKDPTQSDAQYVGVAAGLVSSLIAKVVNDDPFLAIALGVVVAMVSALAASLIRARPVIGILVYCIPPSLLAVLVVATTSPLEYERWLDDRSTRDWVLMIFTAVVAIGVPVSVALIERYRRVVDAAAVRAAGG